MTTFTPDSTIAAPVGDLRQERWAVCWPHLHRSGWDRFGRGEATTFITQEEAEAFRQQIIKVNSRSTLLGMCGGADQLVVARIRPAHPEWASPWEQFHLVQLAQPKQNPAG
jgi:hypothetical protein